MRIKRYGFRFLIFLLSWACRSMYAQSRVHQLARDVYYWAGDLSKHEQTNVGFVVFSEYVLVIDANFPWAAEHILADIKTITSKPVRFVGSEKEQNRETCWKFDNSLWKWRSEGPVGILGAASWSPPSELGKPHRTRLSTF